MGQENMCGTAPKPQPQVEVSKQEALDFHRKRSLIPARPQFPEHESILRVSPTAFPGAVYSNDIYYEGKGQSLTEMLEAQHGQPFPYSHIIALSQACAYSLAYFKKKGFLHHDYYPTQIFYVNSRYKVSNPLTVDEAGYDQTIKQKRFSFLAPQQIEKALQGCNEQSEEQLYRGDVYSIGMLLLEYASMKPAAECYDPNTYSVLDHVVSSRINAVANTYSEQMAVLLTNLLAKDPLHRFKPEDYAHAMYLYSPQQKSSVNGKSTTQSEQKSLFVPQFAPTQTVPYRGQPNLGLYQNVMANSEYPRAMKAVPEVLSPTQVRGYVPLTEQVKSPVQETVMKQYIQCPPPQDYAESKHVFTDYEYQQRQYVYAPQNQYCSAPLENPHTKYLPPAQSPPPQYQYVLPPQYQYAPPPQYQYAAPPQKESNPQQKYEYGATAEKEYVAVSQYGRGDYVQYPSQYVSKGYSNVVGKQLSTPYEAPRVVREPLTREVTVHHMEGDILSTEQMRESRIHEHVRQLNQRIKSEAIAKLKQNNQFGGKASQAKTVQKDNKESYEFQEPPRLQAPRIEALRQESLRFQAPRNDPPRLQPRYSQPKGFLSPVYLQQKEYNTYQGSESTYQTKEYKYQQVMDSKAYQQVMDLKKYQAEMDLKAYQEGTDLRGYQQAMDLKGYQEGISHPSTQGYAYSHEEQLKKGSSEKRMSSSKWSAASREYMAHEYYNPPQYGKANSNFVKKDTPQNLILQAAEITASESQNALNSAQQYRRSSERNGQLK